MIIKTKLELNKYQKACVLSTQILGKLRLAIKSGIYPIDIEKLAISLCQKHHVKPSFLGAGDKGNKYEYATCISVNDTVVHGIPNHDKFEKGDLIKVDFGIIMNGFYTDHCFTVGIPPISPENEKLLTIGREAIWQATKQAIAGNKVGDISAKIHQIAKENSFDTIKIFTGHGIGKSLHEPPQIPSFGTAGSGKLLKEGMVLCIEAQLVKGNDKVFFTPDGWTSKTVSGNPAVMFEYMVVVQKDKPLVLTNTYDWPLYSNSK
jgi:methionyl aminopeptidase